MSELIKEINKAGGELCNEAPCILLISNCTESFREC